MNKKLYKRILVILTVLLISLIFTGCAEINITGAIDPDFMVTYKGDIEIDLSGYQYSQQNLAQESLINLCNYWKEIGYESQVEFTDEVYNVYFKKQIQCENYDEAFKVLFETMTDEYSPFDALSYVFIPYENYSDYTVKGSVDISDAFDMDVYDALNEDIKTEINTEMQNLNANIKFVLPNQDNISQPYTMIKTYTTPITANDATNFVFQGRIYNPDVSAETKNVIDNYNNYNKLNFVLAGILGVLLVLTIIVIAKLKKK